MLAILIIIRDALIAAALAWVGVTMEPARTDAPGGSDNSRVERSN